MKKTNSTTLYFEGSPYASVSHDEGTHFISLSIGEGEEVFASTSLSKEEVGQLIAVLQDFSYALPPLD